MAENNNFHGLMEGVAGVRGIIGGGLTPDVACKYAAAYGTMLGCGEIVVGRDGRPTGGMLFDAVSAGLQAVGCKILDIGIAPTPTIQVTIKKRGSQGGVAITASHNPQEWNALKFFSTTSLFLDEEEGKQLRSIIKGNDIAYVSWDRLGSVSQYEQAVDDHIKLILDIPFLDLPAIRKRDFKVVVDCVNSAGSVIFPQLLLELGCTVVKLNCEPTGLFPRGAEPLPENLKSLCAHVVESGADLGLAVDPDSDRLAMVDEQGHPIGEEYSLVIAADFALRHRKGPIVANISTTRALDDLALKYGVELHRTKVGEIHVAKKMASVGAVIGGEGNGGVILPEVHLGRDAPVGAMLALQYLASHNFTMSEAMAQLPKYYIVKKKIKLGAMEPSRVIDSIVDSMPGAEIDRTDGIKFIYPRRWVQIRPSNTEPILRVFAEAPQLEVAEEMCDEIRDKILKIKLIGASNADMPGRG